MWVYSSVRCKLRYFVNGPKPPYMLNISMKVILQLSIAVSLQNIELRNLIYTQSFDEHRLLIRSPPPSHVNTKTTYDLSSQKRLSMHVIKKARHLG